jgi:N-acetyl-anhydromuramyl-L-alanine amidase AmpD
VIAPDITSSYLYSNKFPPSGKGVVIHATRGGKSMNPTEFQGTLAWFKNPDSQVSSHWVISRTGTKARVVPDTEQAWHAGKHNATHFGIELESAVESDGFTNDQILACAEVCRAYAKDYGIPTVHDFLGFIGHQETPQGIEAGKTDPGNKFPWQGFIALLSPVQRKFLYGDENAGLEVRGNQQFFWNLGVEVDAIGDYAGDFPGAHYHNQGGAWVKVLD